MEYVRLNAATRTMPALRRRCVPAAASSGDSVGAAPGSVSSSVALAPEDPANLPTSYFADDKQMDADDVDDIPPPPSAAAAAATAEAMARKRSVLEVGR